MKSKIMMLHKSICQESTQQCVTHLQGGTKEVKNEPINRRTRLETKE